MLTHLPERWRNFLNWQVKGLLQWLIWITVKLWVLHILGFLYLLKLKGDFNMSHKWPANEMFNKIISYGFQKFYLQNI